MRCVYSAVLASGVGLSLLSSSIPALRSAVASDPINTEPIWTAQEESAQEPAQVPLIPDEPIRIDSSLGLPENLNEPVSIEFQDSTFADLVKWLENDRGLTVLFDRESLDLEGITINSRFADRLDNQPTHLLLDRLRRRQVAWILSDGLLTFTSVEAAQEELTTRPYLIGDLRDQGYELDSIVETITHTTAPMSWENMAGNGRIIALGDVLMILQTDEQHRLVSLLLEGLRNPARRTMIGDSSSHQPLIDALNLPIDCDFDSLPLAKVVDRLRESTGVDIRLNDQLPSRSIENVLVSLSMRGRSLRSVLDSILLGTGLGWSIDSGVLWITDSEEAGELMTVALYNVSDLCRDANETQALMDAVISQVVPDSWVDMGGDGILTSPRPGLISVYHTRAHQDETLALLEAYRFALRNSKPRVESEQDLSAVATVYYRVYTPTAEQLAETLPQLVAPGTWAIEGVAEGGTIRLVTSTPGSSTNLQDSPDPAAESPSEKLPYSVLIVKHQKSVHREIRVVLYRIAQGDPIVGAPFGEDDWVNPEPWRRGNGVGGGMSGGMGGMGGGFGGGFFSIEDSQAHPMPESSEGR